VQRSLFLVHSVRKREGAMILLEFKGRRVTFKRIEVAEKLKKLTPHGSEHPWIELSDKVKRMCPGGFRIGLLSGIIANVIRESYDSAPPDQSISLRLNLPQIVDCFVEDLEFREVLEGLIRSKLQWL
jgi:hypothetical protein